MAVGAGQRGGHADSLSHRTRAGDSAADDQAGGGVVQVGVGADALHHAVDRGDGERRVFIDGADIGYCYRGVVGAGDGDGQDRRTGGPGRVAHGVGKAFIGGLPGPQRLRCRRVGDIAVAAVGVQRQRAVGARQRIAHGTTSDGGDGLGIAAIDVGVVGQDSGGGCRRDGGVFIDRRRVANADWCVVGALNGDDDRRRAGGPGGIGHGIGEAVGQGVADGPQRLHRGVAVVHGIGVSAVGVEHDAAVAAGLGHAQCAAGDRGDGLGVARINVGVVAQDIAARVGTRRAVGHATRFEGGRRVNYRHRPVIGALNGDSYQLIGSTSLAVINRDRIGLHHLLT